MSSTFSLQASSLPGWILITRLTRFIDSLLDLHSIFQSCSLLCARRCLLGKQDFEPLSYKYHNKYTFGPSIESVMANFGGISGGSAPLLPPNVLDLAKLVPLLLRRLRRPDAPGTPEDFTAANDFLDVREFIQ